MYYRASANGGRTFGPAVRITDRIVDRNLGVWSNNSHIHAPVGIVSTDDTVYFTWQDTRNGNKDTSAEDVYFATYRLLGPVRDIVEKPKGVPRWLLVATGLALGAGLALCVVAVLARRRAAPAI